MSEETNGVSSEIMISEWKMRTTSGGFYSILVGHFPAEGLITCSQGGARTAYRWVCYVLPAAHDKILVRYLSLISPAPISTRGGFGCAYSLS